MKLRFYAKGDLLVTTPGFRPSAAGGDIPRRVGRKFVPAKDGKPASSPAKKDPAEFDAESPAGRQLMRQLRQEARTSVNAVSLWAADEATAEACGIPYVRTEFRDGEHVPSKHDPAPKLPKSKE